MLIKVMLINKKHVPLKMSDKLTFIGHFIAPRIISLGLKVQVDTSKRPILFIIWLKYDFRSLNSTNMD